MDWNNCKTEVGMVVERDGKWHLVDETVERDGLIVMLAAWPGAMIRSIDLYTPILPALKPGDDWVHVLCSVWECIDRWCPDGTHRMHCHFQAEQVKFWLDIINRELYWCPDEGSMLPCSLDDLTDHLDDMQKFGALAQWITTAGNAE